MQRILTFYQEKNNSVVGINLTSSGLNDDVMFVLKLTVPVNNFSVMLGQNDDEQSFEQLALVGHVIWELMCYVSTPPTQVMLGPPERFAMNYCFMSTFNSYGHVGMVNCFF